MAKFKIEGYQVGIIVITGLLIILSISLFFVSNKSPSQPEFPSINQPTDQPIDQPTGDSNTGLDAILIIIITSIPVFLILFIFQFLIKHRILNPWGEDTKKKGLVSRITESLTRSKCHGTYDAANKKCSSCEDTEQCKKDTADAVKKIKKGWYQ